MSIKEMRKEPQEADTFSTRGTSGLDLGPEPVLPALSSMEVGRRASCESGAFLFVFLLRFFRRDATFKEHQRRPGKPCGET